MSLESRNRSLEDIPYPKICETRYLINRDNKIGLIVNFAGATRFAPWHPFICQKVFAIKSILESTVDGEVFVPDCESSLDLQIQPAIYRSA